MENVMLDLETLGTSPGCVILSIGATFFDKTRLGEKFYRTIDVQSCIDAGLTVSGDTFKWWMGQKGEARKALFDKTIPVQDALSEFSAWLGQNCETSSVKVWGNGSDFDNAILAKAYGAVLGETQPWRFWNNRCYRTACDLLNDRNRKQEGVYHNALDDAVSQAKHLSRVLTLRGAW